MGDGAGIGPEVILKALVSLGETELSSYLIIGDPRIFLSLIISSGLDLPVKISADPARIEWKSGQLNILEIGELPEKLPVPGEVSAAWARVAMNSVARGVELAQAGNVAALVTAPINKTGIHRAGYHFQGHTDFLAHLTGTENYAMMLMGGVIRVVLVTVHIPLQEVSSSLSRPEIVRKVYLAHYAMRRLGIKDPRVAVAGLNPHAGEAGAFGREEIEIIAPAVEECREGGVQVFGPLPPDTLFHKMMQGEYDVAVVMYHDQGLIPLKMIAFDRGVNITLGLPFVRTSPDHGTAYEIAGKGIANPGSMIEAIKTAAYLLSARSDT